MSGDVLIILACCAVYLAAGGALATRAVRRVVAEDGLPMDNEDWLALSFAWCCFAVAWPAFLLLAFLSLFIRRLVKGGAS